MLFFNFCPKCEKPANLAIPICFLVLGLVNLCPSSFVLASQNCENFEADLAQHATDLMVIEYDPRIDRFCTRLFELQEMRASLEIDGDELKNEHYEVVEGTSNRILSIQDLDGRNVLYHLMRARRYYTQLDPTNPALKGKITVRVRVSVGYNHETHFDSDGCESKNFAQCFNNSRYIFADYLSHHGQDSGQPFRRWGPEIWFHARKRAAVRSHQKRALINLTGKIPFEFGLGLVGDGIGLNLVFDSPHPPSAPLDGADLAKVPVVPYHEAFHSVSGAPKYPFDYMSEGNPLKEDLANYFGTVINGVPKIDFSIFGDSRQTRDFSQVSFPMLPEEEMTYNYLNVVPAILWSIRNRLSDQDAEAHFDQLVWNSMKYMDAATRPSGLPLAIMKAERLSPFDENERNLMKAAFEEDQFFLQQLDSVFSWYYQKK